MDACSRNGTKEPENVLVLKVIDFQLETTNSHNLEEDTVHWQSMYYETPLRFKRSVREIFSKSGSLRVIEKYDD